jgi:hypothetical protein
MNSKTAFPWAIVFMVCSALGAGCEDASFYVDGKDADAAGETLEDPPADPDAVQDSPIDDGTAGDSAEVPPGCEGVTCSSHGVCVSPGGTPACQCEAGYVPNGLSCEADPCASVTCGANAHCAAGACACDEGFEGDPVAGCTPVVTTEDRVRAQLVEIARAELGMCEGVDDRPDMLYQPGMWCYDFVAWVYEQADYALPSPLSLPVYTVGGLPDGWRPEPGDLIKFVYQHYGMVAELSPDGMTITTVEGNYSSCVATRTIMDSEVEYYGSLESVF